eukprot:CAMPEP_0167799662 /NCGR_PEP_ID=MMETSP0111_2-20121227/17195_1 /TAXON_ID=91324 /ORGANISM="Lotharella globosa, Strain CCCM811" /LENGTH=56 /DNA_ID=CAMNT_0007694625 /DNA_START=76 /DNA_END=242 /DNA_ORIENTATION=+
MPQSPSDGKTEPKPIQPLSPLGRRRRHLVPDDEEPHLSNSPDLSFFDQGVIQGAAG